MENLFVFLTFFTALIINGEVLFVIIFYEKMINYFIRSEICVIDFYQKRIGH